jgi:Asp-tRNA(Asn)/Glu-tRNA(Gln) amidotransferase B subunit
MRLKSDSVDYHYFCEPNIVNINIDDEYKSIGEDILVNLPSRVKNELMQQKVPNDIIEQLLNDYDAYQTFKHVNEKINDANLTVT